jgi:hypothetical protein
MSGGGVWRRGPNKEALPNKDREVSRMAVAGIYNYAASSRS